MNMELTYGVSYSTGAAFHFDEKCSAEVFNYCTFSTNTDINLSLVHGGIVHANRNLNNFSMLLYRELWWSNSYARNKYQEVCVTLKTTLPSVKQQCTLKVMKVVSVNVYLPQT